MGRSVRTGIGTSIGRSVRTGIRTSILAPPQAGGPLAEDEAAAHDAGIGAYRDEEAEEACQYAYVQMYKYE